MLIRDIQVFNKESNALDTWDQSANTCILIAFQLMFYLIEKKTSRWLTIKKNYIYAYKRHKACLKWPCWYLKNTNHVAIFFSWSFLFNSYPKFQVNWFKWMCWSLFVFWGFFFNVYDQIPYYFASSINLININQLNLHWLARLSVLM